jgi:oligoribonuclease NrnB/cAMP/cGMP phosphodiesterase (DHH superfamily)
MHKKICIYHGNCADGFSGAWVIRKALSDKGPLDFYPGVYQTEPPDVQGKDVIFVDFSYKLPIMERLVKQAKSVIVLDHHKTAADDLMELRDAEVIFDMTRSGSMIAWDYYFPNQIPPMLLKHVQDRDLWTFKLDGTKEIQAALFSYPYDFKVYDHLMSLTSFDLNQNMRIEGAAIERKHHKDIDELLSVVQRRMNIGGYNVPIANLPYTLVSEAAHKMAQNEPFAGCYWDTLAGRVFGLRSTENGIDVSSIAKLYGGGGHKNAAGFTVSYEVANTFF